MSNEHLMGLKGPKRDETFNLDLTGYSPGGGSDYVATGRYILVVEDAEIVPKKGDKPGANLRLTYRVSEPKCLYTGRKIVEHHPIPTGVLTDPEVRKQTFSLHNFVTFAVWFKAGSKPENLGPISLSAASIRPDLKIGRPGWSICASVKLEVTDNGAQLGKVDRYISPADYSAAPGPEENTSAAVTAAVQAQTPAQPPAAGNGTPAQVQTQAAPPPPPPAPAPAPQVDPLAALFSGV